MTIRTRTISQIGAGVLAGALLAGGPAWAASGSDSSAGSSGDAMSTSQHGQMTASMSKMMHDPKMRTEMREMMPDAMSQMSGMGDMTKGSMTTPKK